VTVPVAFWLPPTTGRGIDRQRGQQDRVHGEELVSVIARAFADDSGLHDGACRHNAGDRDVPVTSPRDGDGTGRLVIVLLSESVIVSPPAGAWPFRMIGRWTIPPGDGSGRERQAL